MIIVVQNERVFTKWPTRGRVETNWDDFQYGAEICRKYRPFPFVCINFSQMFERFSSYSFLTLWPGKLNHLERRASLLLLKWVHHLFFDQVFTPFRLWKNHFRIVQAFHVSAFHFFESVFSYYFMCYLLWQTLPNAVTFPPFPEVVVISDDESVSIFFASYVCARTFSRPKSS